MRNYHTQEEKLLSFFLINISETK